MPQTPMSHASARHLQQILLRTISDDDTDSSDAIAVRIEPLRDFTAVEAIWQELEARAAPSFFLSWLWIGTWLAHLPKDVEPHLLIAEAYGRIVGLAVLCRRKRWRFGPSSRALWSLHETGNAEFDRLSIEYNGILADRSAAEAVTAACLASVVRHLGQSEQLVLSGITANLETVARHAATEAGLMVDVRAADSAYWVDLVATRRVGKDYRSSLGRNTRQAVGRTQRLYGERGPVEHRLMETVSDALTAFSELAELHCARWGRKGAFANPVFGPFHEKLITRGVPTGAVRISRTTVGGRTVGVLYNFVYDGQILHYQSGFRYEEDAKLKPGVLSHVLAIEDCFARGELGYDFMAGSAGHKSRLANAEHSLKWVVMGRDTIARRIVTKLRHAKHALAKRRKPAGEIEKSRPAI